MEIAYSPLINVVFDGNQECNDEPINKIKLRYYPIHSAIPSFFQYKKPVDFLTDEALKNQLATKNIAQIEVEDIFDPTGWINVGMFGGFPTFITGLLFMTAPIGFYNEPIAKIVPLCSRQFKVNYLQNNSTEQELTYPCAFRGWTGSSHDLTSNFIPLPLIVLTIIVTGIALFFFKIRKEIKNQDLVGRYNDQLNLVIKSLDEVNDQTETPPRNAAIAFPYLDNDQLRLLNFSQLKQAKKHFETLFIKKLDASCFSNMQLSIWRLLNHILNADVKRRIEILSEKIFQEIIGSDPHFLQTLIKKISPFNDVIASIFCNILREKILIEDVSYLFSGNDLKEIVQAVSQGSKLKEAIQLKLDRNSRNVEDIQNPFQAFLKTGKSEIDVHEIYSFLKLAKEHQFQEVESFLEKHFEKNMDLILKNQDLKAFLDELTFLNMDSLKLKIDQYFERQWTNRENQPFNAEQFEADYLFAKEYQMDIFEHSLKDYYLVEIQKIILSLDENKWIVQVNQLSGQIERLFNDQKNSYLGHLIEKVNSMLEAHPEKIEKIATAAFEDRNEWLMGLISQAYKKNPGAYSSYWLSPFENIEVIVKK